MLTPTYSWLNALKASQLAKIAVAIGAPSSGRKSAVIESICTALAPSYNEFRQSKRGSLSHQREHPKIQYNGDDPDGTDQSCMTNINGPASIVSIDMGIRTLAYAHLKLAPLAPTSDKTVSTERAAPVLSAWQCLSIAPKPSTSPSQSGQNLVEDAMPTVTQSKESFAPSLYAHYAYDLVKQLLFRFQPTHFLIERQRFRSGGNSAVLDWTIRVGVFEGMLHAAIRAVCEERNLNVHVSSVEPKRVVRYWLGDRMSADDAVKGPRKKRVSSKEVKQEKIDVVGRWLKGDDDMQSPICLIEEAAQSTVTAYLDKWQGKGKGTKSSDSILRLNKLDDLADSLLQGMAYIEWQKWRAEIAATGPETLLEDASTTVRSSNPLRASGPPRKGRAI